MKLLLVVVTFGILQTGWTMERCIKTKLCDDDFGAEAIRAGSNQEVYCVAVRKRVHCLETVMNDCNKEQIDWIRRDIKTTWDGNPTCDAVSVSSMTLGLMVCISVLAHLFSKH